MNNTFGTKYKITLYGQSHSKILGVNIENVPKGIELNLSNLSKALERRRDGDMPQMTKLCTTPRKEEDRAIFKEGLSKKSGECYITTGENIVIEFENKNIKEDDYESVIDTPRPSHADFVNQIKYKGNPIMIKGGGISSGRMTLPLVAAGEIAKEIINFKLKDKEKIDSLFGTIEVNGYITSIYGETDKEKWSEILQSAASEGDSVGGVVECTIEYLPKGVGEPFFSSLESVIASLALSVPGIKGIEFGNGFNCTLLKGSENNDPLINELGTTKTNNSGGINGGISNGNPVVFRVAVKPTASIAKPQQTFSFRSGRVEEIKIKGRHDVCFALRVPVVIEAITYIAIANLL